MRAWLLGLLLLALSAAPALAQPVSDPALTAALRRHGDFQQTLVDLERLTDEGSPGAAAMLAGFRALQRRDFQAACRAWEAGAGVSAEAAHSTAECYEQGYDGWPVDMTRAVDLYRQAGEGGFGKSLCALGNLYAAGNGVEADPGRAIELCRRGADMGDPDAQTDLGNFYVNGVGTPVDFAEARRLYELAAAQGQANAAYSLGVLRWNGDGGPQDRSGAVPAWRVAYEGGREDAAFLIATEALIRAVGVRGDQPVEVAALAEAKTWFEIAMNDDPDATQRATAALRLAEISGYEELARRQAAQ